jgi:transaldolase
MRIFLDTANVEQIRRGVATGCVSGVTTNPTIIAREGKPFEHCIGEIAAIDARLTILAEAMGPDANHLISEARSIAALAPDIVVKLPMTPDGLAAARYLESAGIRTAVTLIFSPTQAIAASCAGAAFIAPFVGRLDDTGTDGVELVRAIHDTFAAQGVTTRIVAASIRTPKAVGDLFAAGANVVTMPFGVFESMLVHPLTEAGLAKFTEDWQRVSTSIHPAEH